jgi:hypothetical protein
MMEVQMSEQDAKDLTLHVGIRDYYVKCPRCGVAFHSNLYPFIPYDTIWDRVRYHYNHNHVFTGVEQRELNGNG